MQAVQINSPVLVPSASGETNTNNGVMGDTGDSRDYLPECCGIKMPDETVFGILWGVNTVAFLVCWIMTFVEWRKDNGNPLFYAWGLLAVTTIGIIFNTWFFWWMDRGLNIICSFYVSICFAVVYPFVCLLEVVWHLLHQILK